MLVEADQPGAGRVVLIAHTRRKVMAEERMYTTTQLAVAARELREAAGAEEQTVTADEAIEMLGDEIRLLRERGFSDEQIAGLFTGFDIEVTTEEIAKHAPPRL
jgi:hypothetical protein